MVRLIYENPNPVPANNSPVFACPNTPGVAYQRTSYYETVMNSILPHFAADIHMVGPSFYTLAARDLSHYLACDIPLEIQEGQDESEFGSVTCHLPIIEEQYLEALVWGDEMLVDMVAAQFYLKVLERLLNFCANHNATRLVIDLPSSKSPATQFYKPFVAPEESPGYGSRDATLIIHPDRATYEKLVLHVADLSQEFQGLLEEEKWDNPMVQQYLKLRSFSRTTEDDLLTP